MADVFRRKIYDKLVDWKNVSSGSSAMLIEGARRVGKTTVAEEFGRREYKSYLLIDFVTPLPGTIDVFEAYGHDIGMLLSNLSLIYGVKLYERKSLIIFDEVQRYVRARELIKYFVMDGRYDYLETGSLISIKKNVKDIQIPSEEESVQMNPMDFEEWLWANGDQETYDVIRDHFTRRVPLGQTMHGAVMRKYRTYMIVGGMPAAVAAFVNTHDISASERIKRQIIKLYREDMMKIPDGYGERALAVFDRVPEMLSSHRKVFRPGTVEPGTVSDDYAESISWLCEAKVVNKCISNSDPSPAMNMTNRSESIKLYMLDTGLLMTIAFDVGNLDESVLVDFAKSRISVNKGMLFENAVAQSLVAAGTNLYFHEFYLDGDDKHIYEVDFILVRGPKIIPVEVKSSQSNRHTSFDRFLEKFRKRIDEAFVVHTKDLRMDGKVTYVPVYMAQMLSEGAKGRPLNR